jgi:hypothetical protein
VSDSASTGSFWRCPSCGKHAPSRQTTCRCGFVRSDAPFAQQVRVGPEAQRVETGQGTGTRWGAIGAALLVLLVLGGSGYMAIESWNAPRPEDSELARRIRESREAQARRQPEVVYIPVPGQSPTSSPSLQSLVESTPSPAVPPLLDQVQPVPDSPPPAAPQVAPPPSTMESEIDAKRRVGTQAFERDITALAEKADRADVAWHRFAEGCRQEITTATAVAGVADRDWIAVAGASVTTTRWTDACADLGTFYALVLQVRDGMCVAEDRARQAWVYPGVRRDIRHRYRLDWAGWDSVCR